MYILSNALSLNMFAHETSYSLALHPLTLDEARERLVLEGFESAVGHPATAHVLSTQLGLAVCFNRVSISLHRGNDLIIAQATMPRLAEGQLLSIEEMEAIPLHFWLLNIKVI